MRRQDPGEENVLHVKPNDLLTYYFDSLAPYLTGTHG